MIKLIWQNSKTQTSKSFVCGYCGHPLASQIGYSATATGGATPKHAHIYICHHCGKPTFFGFDGQQVPGPVFGNAVRFIPDENVVKLFDEARSCFTIGAFTSSVLCCRKLLMNIAVAEGAAEGKSLVEYIDYLESKSYIPPNGKLWVDMIRKLGNDATHRIEFRSPEEAKLVLTFTEMLLKFIYEMPGLLNGGTLDPES
jgi:hypothetical protein